MNVKVWNTQSAVQIIQNCPQTNNGKEYRPTLSWKKQMKKGMKANTSILTMDDNPDNI